MLLNSALFPLLFALPALSIPRALPRSAGSENWTISAFTGHFMGDNSGLPGNTWPPNSGFNTTLAFTLNFPDNSSTTCDADFAEPPTPTDYTDCGAGAGSVSFKITKAMASPSKWALYSFVLDVIRVQANGSTAHASRHISADNATNPDSYLTCLAFAPLTGVHCQLGGVLGQPGPIPLVAALST